MSSRGWEDLKKELETAANRLLDGSIIYTHLEVSKDPEPGPPPEDSGLPRPLVEALRAEGIERLYRFQWEAIKKWRSGYNLVIASGTGTGKTEAFLLPLLEEVYKTGSRALLFYPTKSLARDQLPRITRYASSLGLRAEVLDGDTSSSQRGAIYSEPPDITITNPDFVHYALAFSGRARRLLATTSAVVLDEAHVYSGVFGSHMRWIIYRLERIAGRRIKTALAGATVGDPLRLARSLTSREAALISGPARRRGWALHAFLSTGRMSRWRAAAALLSWLAGRGFKVLGFAESHQMVELIARIARRSFGREILVHRAGLRAEERRRVEDALKSGEAPVVATPTLELGVDIGFLDAIVMAHIPRSYTSYIQRAGRVGRRGSGGLVATLLGDDAIEAYYCRRPSEYFSQQPPPSYVEPGNREVARVHAAAIALTEGLVEVTGLEEPLRRAVEDLASEGKLISAGTGVYKPLRSRLARILEASSLRGTGPRVRIVDEHGRVLGYRELPQALYDLHPGAVYYHGGRTLLSLALNLDSMVALARGVSGVSYYTKPLYTVDLRDVVPLDERTSEASGVKLLYADLRLSIGVTGYVARDEYTGRRLSEYYFKSPLTWSFWTKGVLTRYPNPGLGEGEESLSAFHALEHALIHASRPVAGASDADLGGISYPSGHIVVYDSTPSGHGASRLVFERFERVEDIAENTLVSCSCRDGCPRCIYSPYCGVNNRFLSRRRAAAVLHHAFRVGKGVKLGKPLGSPLA
ncbi:DEAD/DEAH box helicase [Aeropyrum camini]|uniref:ATP-dependent helicase n=1 Tax=Aeropyrum camini SY1 = JCM 12091 TaxID=1198449 RepID=U3TC82_9CREN|nr:DEAD/DEAH box helicase [Aeropyrum camini]BAN89625.1 ATP-dependent helicase [Aeropyrum camini SY1 = JCM 12091]